jgi:laminin B (domain IV)
VRLTRLLPVLAVSLLACNAAEITLLESNFDSGIEGWSIGELFTVTHGSAPQYVNTGGVTGGFIQTADLYAFNAFRAPSNWLGDQSSLFGATMRISERVRSSDGLPYPLVVIGSGSTRLQFRAAPPGTDWTTFIVPLRADAGWELADGSGGPGVSVTDAQLKAALSKVDWLGIDADWHTGADLVGLDNVKVSFPDNITVHTPEPSTVLLVISGLCAAVVLKRRR